ncbi:hypothetical protein [Streptomyces prunicolor]|uniref:hypothetical protein n=1 Tax=Streptomyces prunicolor TaxID=67348 RepID=UPI00035DBFB5|nr:hypothetical protein [Streptomyces prunicolor]
MDDLAHGVLPRCSFYERTPVEGGYRYEKISIKSPRGDTHMVTGHPPLVGDLIYLRDMVKERGGQFRVIDRSWLHSSWGSTSWPYDQPASSVGPLLDIVVEATEGPFVNEVPGVEEESSDG